MENNESKNKFKQEDDSIPNDFDAKGYSLSGKVMLCAIVFLFFVVVLMLCLHIYARWYLLRARRRHIRRNRLRRRTQLVFYTDNPTATVSAASRGLDASVLASLPLFSYDPNTHPENAAECAVCLSEFESGEMGRVLPKCNHAFHTECIDMWFHSHSTCPLCRTPVEPAPEAMARPEVVLTVCGSEPETGSSSGASLEDENRTSREISSSSVGLRRKPSFAGVTVEVPSRNEAFRDESSCDSPSTQSSFRSPMSRMLSLKRILSRERKGSVSPSSYGGCVGGCSSAAELDAELGRREETR